MEQKIVSFKVANVIKEAGYPQCGDWWYSENGGLSDDWIPEMMYCAAPTYIDVWLWMCREKHSCLSTMYDSEIHKWYIDEFKWKHEYFSDPEEAIKSAIEYICENNLIK